MHIQDGVLSPIVCAATGVLSLSAVTYSLHRLKESVGDRTIHVGFDISGLCPINAVD